MTCIECATELEQKATPMKGEIKGEEFTVTLDGLVCSNCGFATVAGNDMPELMRRLADEYRSKHGLLTSTQIRERRLALKMSQAEFAEYLGVGVASVKRWELGQVQDASMNRLMVLLTDENAALANFREIQSRTGRVTFPPANVWAGGVVGSRGDHVIGRVVNQGIDSFVLREASLGPWVVEYKYGHAASWLHVNEPQFGFAFVEERKTEVPDKGFSEFTWLGEMTA